MKIAEIPIGDLHEDQARAFDLTEECDFVAVRCGRRWGKTRLGTMIAVDAAIKREPVGWFAPEYKFLSETYNQIREMLRPVTVSSSKTEGVIRVVGGGRIDFWSLENEAAGRSRHYKRVILDEVAFTKPVMIDIWEQSIKPTLFDYSGFALALSNTAGNDPANFFWQICNKPELGFREHHAPTMNNPLLPFRLKDETDDQYALRRAAVHAKLAADNHPLVYQQEYLAEFVDWSGTAFFQLDKMLQDGKPVDPPPKCDGVYAVVDSASKTGKENDGTAVTYYLIARHLPAPLIILDWDIVQIEGALLETWLPNIFGNLEAMAKQYGARAGSLGVYIEDKDSGTILLQQAARHGWNAQALPSAMTAAGKDQRAISVSGYVYRAMVKFSRLAHDKVTTFKTITKNHLISQVVGFRVGDKDAARRADDLLDTFTYGVAIALGNSEGY